MTPLNLKDVKMYIEQNIATFHKGRLESLKKLPLKKVLKQKNPYLFKAKNILFAQDLVKLFLDAYLSSQEETIFGNFLEGLAIFVNEKFHGGWKSSAQGIDLEFNKSGVRYIVVVKSGPNWGNSSQLRKMKDDFRKAKQTIRSNNPNLNIVAVNGCCYGRNIKPDKGDYFKYCGQKFWEFNSGSKELYLKIIKPLGYAAKEHNEEFQKEYAKTVNMFTTEFAKDFCLHDGSIDWEKLVKFVSEEKFQVECYGE
ncbi:MAG: cytosolic protein [Chloroflexi bacterium]|nr:cytosolic protein [Chloroflexota bacterium]